MRFQVQGRSENKSKFQNLEINKTRKCAAAILMKKNLIVLHISTVQHFTARIHTCHDLLQ